MNNNRGSLTKEPSNKNLFDIFIDKLTPSKRTENDIDASPGGSLKKPILVSFGGGGSPAVTPQKTPVSQANVQSTPKGQGRWGTGTPKNDAHGAMDKTLFFSSIDSSVVIGKDVNSNYLSAVEQQISVLNKKATLTNKEKPKKMMTREPSFQNKFVDAQMMGEMSEGSITPSVSIDDLSSYNGVIVNESNNNFVQNVTLNPTPSQGLSGSAGNQKEAGTKGASSGEAKTSTPIATITTSSAQASGKSTVVPTATPTPSGNAQTAGKSTVVPTATTSSANSQTNGKPTVAPTVTAPSANTQSKQPGKQSKQQQQKDDEQYDDPNPLPFQLSELSIEARLYLDHLKTENDELKRQLNIVLTDNAEQRENTIHLQSMIKELEEYTDQQDGWVSELRNELIISTELLLNHHQKIDNLSEILTGCDEQKEQFHSLYAQSQERLENIEEDNENLTGEVNYLKKLTHQLDTQILDLNKEIKQSKEFKIETIIHRIQNSIEPSGIERIKSFQDKDLLLQEAVRIYQTSLQEDVLLEVVIFLRNSLHWTVFIQLLRNYKESLDYFIRYCKMTKNFVDLEQVYRDTHNTVEEGFLIILKAAQNRDVEQKYIKLDEAIQYFDQYPHLSSYREIVVNYLNQKRNGITLSTQDFNRQFIYQQNLQFISNKK